MKLYAQIVLLLYKILTIFIAPIGATFLSYKKRKDPSYGVKFFNLLGFYKKQSGNFVWFHGASVGEINALKPLVNEFTKTHPNQKVVVTTMTMTGYLQARTIKDVHVAISPLDSPLSLWGFFHAFHPKALFIIDTELWPNMLDKAYKNHCPVVIFNARLQDKNVKSYLKHKFLVKHLIADKLSSVLCMSFADLMRFKHIGVDEDKLKVTGNIKYDLKPRDELFAKALTYKNQLFKGKVFGAISTHEGEEEIVINSFIEAKKHLSNLKLVLVPRHQTTVSKACELLTSNQITFKKKSELKDLCDFSADVLIGDTMGEIELYLGLCDLVFMGGSFVNVGGHNPLEPAYFSLPILTGPDYHNFQEQFDKLIDANGAYLAYDPKELTRLIVKLLEDQELLEKTGIKALDIQQQGRGALKRTLSNMEKFIN